MTRTSRTSSIESQTLFDFNGFDMLGLKGLDIDGTLTEHGKLTADAYLALWRLQAAGLRVVPVTGRPAGLSEVAIPANMGIQVAASPIVIL